jgi:hypothetical protein
MFECSELKLYSAYRPVNVVCWKRAICLEFIGKVSIPDTNTKAPSFFRVHQLWPPMLMKLYSCSRFSTRNVMIDLAMQADVLEYYDQTVSSPSGSFYIPAVLRVHMWHIYWTLFIELLLNWHDLLTVLFLLWCSGSTVAAGSKEKKSQAEP